jgi:hypothetical protein
MDWRRSHGAFTDYDLASTVDSQFTSGLWEAVLTVECRAYPHLWSDYRRLCQRVFDIGRDVCRITDHSWLWWRDDQGRGTPVTSRDRPSPPPADPRLHVLCAVLCRLNLGGVVDLRHTTHEQHGMELATSQPVPSSRTDTRPRPHRLDAREPTFHG